MSKQSEAVREYFDKNGILQKDVCEALGLHSGTLSNILSGRYGISKKTAQKMAAVYGFDISYLLTGEGTLIAPGGFHARRIDQSHNSGNIANGGAINTIAGDSALAVENAQLREQLEQAKEEKARLLGIIETLTKK